MARIRKAFSLIEVSIVLAVIAILISVTISVSDFVMEDRRREGYYQSLKLSYNELVLLDLQDNKIADYTTNGVMVISDINENIYYVKIEDSKLTDFEYSDKELRPSFSEYNYSFGFEYVDKELKEAKNNNDIQFSDPEFDTIKEAFKKRRAVFYFK